MDSGFTKTSQFINRENDSAKDVALGTTAPTMSQEDWTEFNTLRQSFKEGSPFELTQDEALAQKHANYNNYDTFTKSVKEDEVALDAAGKLHHQNTYADTSAAMVMIRNGHDPHIVIDSLVNKQAEQMKEIPVTEKTTIGLQRLKEKIDDIGVKKIREMDDRESMGFCTEFSKEHAMGSEAFELAFPGLGIQHQHWGQQSDNISGSKLNDTMAFRGLEGNSPAALNLNSRFTGAVHADTRDITTPDTQAPALATPRLGG